MKNKVGFINFEEFEMAGISINWGNGGHILTIRFGTREYDAEGDEPLHTFREFVSTVNSQPFFDLTYSDKPDSEIKAAVDKKMRKGMINIDINESDVDPNKIADAIKAIITEWSARWRENKEKKLAAKLAENDS